MKRILIFGFLVVITVFAWRVGERLSADALGMAVGVGFGIVAGVPAALLVLASSRRRESRGEDEMAPRNTRTQPGGYPSAPYGYLPQPPVIVLAGSGVPSQSIPTYSGLQQARLSQYALTGAEQNVVDAREFRVVGESDESLDEW